MKENEKYSKLVGLILSVFTSIIGLLVGICLFNKSETDRNGFIKGWLIGTLFILIFITLVLIVGYIISLNKLGIL